MKRYARSIQELIALARARPGELVYATNGYGTGQHLSGELLKVTTSSIDRRVPRFDASMTPGTRARHPRRRGKGLLFADAVEHDRLAHRERARQQVFQLRRLFHSECSAPERLGHFGQIRSL